MPSSHAANWFAAIVVLGAYYRRTVRWTLPLGVAVSFSRVYNGVHYPSDVAAGMLLGAGTAWAVLHATETVWRKAGCRWFPFWSAGLPSLLNPDCPAAPDKSESLPPQERERLAELQWVRLGYLVIGMLLALRWLYLASGRVELSEDEAYQWTWSKHLDLSYFSKPPFIAYAQFIGTSLWGDTVFGVRFLAPLLSAGMGLMLLRFFAREVNARAGFFLVLAANAAPLLIAGSALMTIDPLSVFFWVAAMVTGWRAVRENRLAQWTLTGLFMGCGFLSKYTNLFQLLSWAVFFLLWPSARGRLRERGPWVALLVTLLCTVPVLVWNAQHDWITVAHVASNGGLDRPWQPRLKYCFEFLGAEFGLLNPVFFVAAFWAALGFWKLGERQSLMRYLFSMGAPLFLFYWLYTARNRVQPNWIAPSALPLFALMTVYWEQRWRAGLKRAPKFLWAGLAFGVVAAAVMLFPEILEKVSGRRLPARYDPLRRVRAWTDTARVVDEARRKLAAEGRPTFIIAAHYGLTGQCSFCIPEAREAVTREPMVYFQSSDRPLNQYYFWPGYLGRKGQDAIFVREASAPGPPPSRLVGEFESVEDLGIHDALFRGEVYRRLQLFACRGLR